MPLQPQLRDRFEGLIALVGYEASARELVLPLAVRRFRLNGPYGLIPNYSDGRTTINQELNLLPLPCLAIEPIKAVRGHLDQCSN